MAGYFGAGDLFLSLKNSAGLFEGFGSSLHTDRFALNTPSELLLHRLFHDVECSSRDPLPLHVRCRCSRDKVADVLRRIGRDDAFAATHELGHAQIICEFCGKVYRFDPIEIEQLFQPIVAPAPRLQ